MFGVGLWQKTFIENVYLGLILGWLMYLLFIILASAITFILSIIFTFKDVMIARRLIKENNQVFIYLALKHKMIKRTRNNQRTTRKQPRNNLKR